MSSELGHLIGDEVSSAHNSPSTEHYFHYYLVDEDERTINSMGVMSERQFNEVEDYNTSDNLEKAIADNKRTVLQVRLSTKQRFQSFQGDNMNENDTLNLVLDKAEQTKKLETKLQQTSNLETTLRDRETALRDRIAALEAQLTNLQKSKPSTTEDTSLPAPDPEVSSSDNEEVSSLQDTVKLLVQSQTQLNQKLDLFLERSTDSSLPNNTPSSAPSNSASTTKDEEQITKDDKNDSLTSHEELISHAIDKVMAHNNSAKNHEDKWYIGIRPLKDVVNYQIPITKVVKQRKDEIRQHHKFHSIKQTHNARFHTAQRYSDFFDFD